MINIPPIKPSTSIKAEILPDITKTWKVNQVINATTERGGEALSKVILRVGQHLLEAQTPIPLKTGDSLRLLIKSMGETPLLNIQTSTTQAELATDKLRLFIAQQQSLSTFIKMTQKLISGDNIPTNVKNLLNQLISSIPSKEQFLQPARLKQIIQNSGVFLEPKLAIQNTSNINQDVKAQLIKISNTIQSHLIANNTPSTEKNLNNLISNFVKGNISIKQLSQQLPALLTKAQTLSLETHLKTFDKLSFTVAKTDSLYNLNQLFTHLHKHIQTKQLIESLLNAVKNNTAMSELKVAVDNALSAITSQQLTPLTKEADNFLLLLFGILIKDKEHIDLINFKIEQESNNNNNEDTNWTVTLNFHFKATGKFQAKVHLLDTQISTVFTAENTQTSQLIKSNFHLLNNAFKNLGFNKITLDVTQNKISDSLDKPGNIQILDERA
jgi:Flagellar hook-length control protein FliK